MTDFLVAVAIACSIVVLIVVFVVALLYITGPAMEKRDGKDDIILEVLREQDMRAIDIYKATDISITRVYGGLIRLGKSGKVRVYRVGNQTYYGVKHD